LQPLLLLGSKSQKAAVPTRQAGQQQKPGTLLANGNGQSRPVVGEVTLVCQRLHLKLVNLQSILLGLEGKLKAGDPVSGITLGNPLGHNPVTRPKSDGHPAGSRTTLGFFPRRRGPDTSGYGHLNDNFVPLKSNVWVP
jgi:hypothetical protein